MSSPVQALSSRRVTTAGVILFVAAAAASCSNSGSPPASAFVSATIGNNEMTIGTGDGGTSPMCNLNQPSDTPFFTLGTPGSPPVPVANGNSPDAGGTMSVTCQVSPGSTSGTWNVALAANNGTYGIQISGVVTSGQTSANVSAEFNDNGFADYGSTMAQPCTITFNTTAGQEATDTRIWAQLSCPVLVDPAASFTCAGTAEFLFEYCAG